MELRLTDQERDTLRHALDVYLRELREEILKTEKREWRIKLHEEEDLLRQVVGKLCQTVEC